MTVYPLELNAFTGSRMGTSAFKSVLDDGMSMMGGLTSIGAAIASIFILFVIFSCIASILDGGKFNVKMLGPVVIYLLVCNFGIVAQPVTSFVSALQSGTAGQIRDARDGLYKDENGNSISKMKKLMESYKQNNAEAIAELEKKLNEDKKNDKPANIEITEKGSGDKDKSDRKLFDFNFNFREIGDNIKRSLQNFWDDKKVDFTKAFVSAEIHERRDFRSTICAVGVTFILSTVLDWFVGLLSIVMTAMGGVLAGVAIAFGPISWAFGVLPGNGHVIKTWFIRICQFALYSPLCQLVCYFSDKIFFSMVGAPTTGGVSTLGLAAVLLCNLVMLTAIPQIASSIIEGASGGLALSTGVQTLMSPMRIISEWNMSGEKGRDKQQMSLGQQQLNTLKEISTKLGGGTAGGPPTPPGGGGGAAGQPPILT